MRQDLNSEACAGEEAKFLNDLRVFPKSRAAKAGLAPGNSSLIPDQICLATEILFFSSLPALQFNLDWRVKSSASSPLFLLCCSSEVKSLSEGSDGIFLAEGILQEQPAAPVWASITMSWGRRGLGGRGARWQPQQADSHFGNG